MKQITDKDLKRAMARLATPGPGEPSLTTARGILRDYLPVVSEPLREQILVGAVALIMANTGSKDATQVARLAFALGLSLGLELR